MDAPTQCWSRGRTTLSGAHVVHTLRTRCRPFILRLDTLGMLALALVLSALRAFDEPPGEAHY